jgi:ribosomal protein S26
MCIYTMYVRMCVYVRARYIHYATHLKLVKVRSVPTRKIHHGAPQHELACDDEVTSG